MSKYVIITDSNVDIPDDLAKELELEIIPMTVTVKGKEHRNFLDGREISPKVFYDLLREKELASTAQINPADFLEVWKPFLEKGLDILSISFSSALSGTYNSSLIAKKELEEMYPERKILCVDSLSASMGQGLFATYAALMRKEGKSIEEVAKYLEDNRLDFVHLFTVGDLGHLRRGGRLSASSYILGNLLSIKPLLHVSVDGKLKVYGKARGRFKAINNMITRMEDTFSREKTKYVYISHGDCLEDAEYAKELIKEKLNLPEEMFVLNPIGPVIGAHSGVNTLAIFYLGSERYLGE